VQNRATTELNIGTFVWVSTLFCDLQLPLRLVPELVVAAFGFARLLPKLERTFPYLLFGWLGHDAFPQSRRSRPGQESQKATAGGIFTCGSNSQFWLGRVVPYLLDPAGAHGEPSKPDNVSAVRVEVPHE
jgi:hypothetical protein